MCHSTYVNSNFTKYRQMAFQVTIPAFPPTTKVDHGIIHQSIIWVGFLIS